MSAGVLDYQRYNELFATVKDVIEHFPSEQYTLPYSFNELGADGWTATIWWQSLIIDSMTYDQDRTPNFTNTKVIGYFPAKSKAQPLAGNVQLPADMYTYRMYPERLEKVPITVVNYTFYKNDQIFSRQVLLIENWEPGIPIGDPEDEEEYEPVELKPIRIKVDLKLNTSTVTPIKLITATATATFIGTVSQDISIIDNNLTFTVSAQPPATGEIVKPVNTTSNFVSGKFSATYSVNNQFIPIALVGNNYNITTGTIGPTQFTFTAIRYKNYRNELRWQSKRIGTDTILLGGTTSTNLLVTATSNLASLLVPLTLDAIDVFTNQQTNSVFSNKTTRLRARANLGSNYVGTATQVEFYAFYTPNYSLGNFILPTSDPVGDGIISVFKAYMPKKLAPNQIILEKTIGNVVNETFNFPGNLDTATYTVNTQTTICCPERTSLLLDKNWTINPYYTGFYSTVTQVIAATENYTISAFSIPYVMSRGQFNNDFASGYWINYEPGLPYPKETTLAGYTAVPLVNGRPQRRYVTWPSKTVFTRTFTPWNALYANAANHTLNTYTNAISYLGGREILFSNNNSPVLKPKVYQGSWWLEQPYLGGLAWFYHDLFVDINDFKKEKAALLQLDQDDYGLRDNLEHEITQGDRIYANSVPANITTGSIFNLNTLTSAISSNNYYSVTKRELSPTGRTILYVDPPWINHNPGAFDDIADKNIVVEVPTNVNGYYTAKIIDIEYTYGVNVPYYTGAYSFNRVQFDRPVVANSLFRLAGNTQSPIDTTFVITTATDSQGWTIIDPPYTIPVAGSDPQWQKDNVIYNYFNANEKGRDIAFYYNLYNSSSAKVLAVYGQLVINGGVIPIFIFDRLPPNLAVGAYFKLESVKPGTGGFFVNVYQDFYVYQIDFFRRLVWAVPGLQSGFPSPYNFIGRTTTFVNPPAPPQSTIFLGTATNFVKTGDECLWYLDRQLIQGSYAVTATIKQNVILGFNAPTKYARNNTTSLSLNSADGLSAGLIMTIDQSSTASDRVVITCQIPTAKTFNNFYVFPTPIEWYVNGGLITTTPFVRQGLSYVQTSTLVIAKGIINPSFYADWNGTLDYVRTSPDQYLFLPDTIFPRPPYTTTILLSYNENNAINHTINASGQVIIQDPPPQHIVDLSQDDFIPDGVITFTALRATKNFSSSQYQFTGQRFLLSTATMSGGIASINVAAPQIIPPSEFGNNYAIEAVYSGDAYRYSSTVTSAVKTIYPTSRAYYTGLITDNFARSIPIVTGTNPAWRILINNYAPTVPKFQYSDYNFPPAGKRLYWTFTVDIWIEPKDFWTNVSSYELTNVETVLATTLRLKGPSYPISPFYNTAAVNLPYTPGGNPQTATVNYSSTVNYTPGVPYLKRTIAVTQVINFASLSTIDELVSANLELLVGYPAGWLNRNMIISYAVRNMTWSATMP